MIGGAARAEPSEAERAARWSDLRHAIFGDRVVEDAGDLVTIDAPARAEDAAIVPVAIRVAERLGPDIRGLYLVIDDNPSPLAAHFVLGPLADTSEIATRVRIDDYTYLHAVAETSDGRLYATAQFIKAAGGCSAPAGKDQALALERLGKMKLTMAERPTPDAPIKVKLLVSHPNNSGLQMDQVTRNYIPADFMQTLEVTYNGQSVFRLDFGHRDQRGSELRLQLSSGGSGGCGGDQGRDSRQQPAALQPKLADSRRRAANVSAVIGTADWLRPGLCAALR